MATQQSTVDFILEQINEPVSVSAKKMFGEYGLFCEDKMVAVIGDDQLFVKMTPGGSALVGDCAQVPPYPGAKPCFLIPGETWDIPGYLANLVKQTAIELPASKKKTKK